MRILKFNESVIKEDIEDIFITFIDYGLTVEISEVYVDDNFHTREDPDRYYKKPGHKISISGRGLELDKISEITSDIGEVKSRLSDIGENELKSFSFERKSTRLIFVLIDKESVDIKTSEKEGFYFFSDKAKNAFNQSNNKVTRAFNIKQGNDELILEPKGEVQSKSLLNDVKRFIRNKFEPKVWYAGGPNWVYNFEFKIFDNKIIISYISRVDRTNR